MFPTLASALLTNFMPKMELSTFSPVQWLRVQPSIPTQNRNTGETGDIYVTDEQTKATGMPKHCCPLFGGG